MMNNLRGRRYSDLEVARWYSYDHGRLVRGLIIWYPNQLWDIVMVGQFYREESWYLRSFVESMELNINNSNNIWFHSPFHYPTLPSLKHTLFLRPTFSPSSPSRNAPPPINLQTSPRNKLRLITRQEQTIIRHILRRTQTSQGHIEEKLVAILGRIL